MKKRKIIALFLVTCGLLNGCAGKPKEQSSAPVEESQNIEQSDSEPDDQSVSEAEKEAPEVDPAIPMLCIDTVSRDPNVMDFVTQPVAQHVAEQIASWTPGYQMPPAPYYEACQITLYDPKQDGTPAALDAEVKVRGNWTTTYDKKPLRIKFTEKQNLLGLNGGAEFKNWLLLAAYKDGSMLRDKTALSIAREILEPDGLYAADAQLVEVQINGEYWGVYLLTEQQQVDNDRIAITEPEQPDYTGTDIGYLLEFDGYYYNEEPLQQFHVDYNDNAPLKPFEGDEEPKQTITCLPENDDDIKRDVGMTIKSKINSQEQHDFIANYVNQVYRIMYAAAYEDKAYQFNKDYSDIEPADQMTPQEAVEAVVNVKSLADAYVIAELTCDADIYWSSFYMDADFGPDGDKKLTFEAPWDFDSGLGNKKRCKDGTGFYAGSIVPDVDDNTYETVNPWLAVLMHEEWYQDIIRETWTKAYDSGVFTNAVRTVMADSETAKEAFKRNYAKWDNLIHNEAFSMELCKRARDAKSQKEAADYLADWLQSRINFLNDYWHS